MKRENTGKAGYTKYFSLGTSLAGWFFSQSFQNNNNKRQQYFQQKKSTTENIQTTAETEKVKTMM